MVSVHGEGGGSNQIFLEEIVPWAEQRQASLVGEMTGAHLR